MSYLAENIKHLRASINLNQEPFGELFGLSRDNIASYERGTEPKLTTLVKIVNYFHISLDDIVNVKLSENLGSNLGANSGSNNKKKSNSADQQTNKYSGKDILYYERILDERERTIEALNEVINTQKETIEALKISSNIDSKRKTG